MIRSTAVVDVLGADEPLPEWAGRMIDRSLEDPGEHAADESVVRVVAADLIATLGWTTEQAERVARRTAAVRREIDGDAFDVAEDISMAPRHVPRHNVAGNAVITARTPSGSMRS